ncbi:hypothetical protein [Amaricoccus sp.]|uniref:hypothetical protein n=1 Tax=Amaricoccus sp. TaxID=1872485 RepID=UPI002605C119|nr:hypothetical protein [Amaricoccus sp.]HRO12306.1 hypothetical protein [Amaricoccus sp.]
MRLEKLAGMAMALALAGGAAEAAPYSIVADEPGSAWVLDVASGALTRCVTRAAAAPKVLDVFGDSAEVRPQTARAGRTDCREVRSAAIDPRVHRLAAIFRARTGTLADLYRSGLPRHRGMYGGMYGGMFGAAIGGY